MSLDFIKKSKTIVKVVDGVSVWSNPNVSVSITSLGKVLDVCGNEIKQNTSRTYTIRVIDSSGKRMGWVASYRSLFARMVLGIKLAGKTISRIDETKGWELSNVQVIKLNAIPTDLKPKKMYVVNNTIVIEDRLHYKLVYGKTEWITEDGAKFPNKELADWHQNSVSKGKGNAQVVLDYNGGWVLAEQIYLQEVIYNCDKPYVNFADVVNNNNGVLKSEQQERVVFNRDKLPVRMNVTKSLHDFSWVEGYECNKKEAEAINESLNKTMDAFSYFDVLASLVKEFKK